MGQPLGKEVAPKGGKDLGWPHASPHGGATAGQRIAVIGAGATGLAAAYHLATQSDLDFVVFEASDRAGGHAMTHKLKEDGTEVDCGFMVYNYQNYPNMTSLFRELGVKGQATDMSFSCSLRGGSNEWSSLNLLATFSNIFSFSFGAMLVDMLRFNREASAVLSLPEDDPQRRMPMGEWLRLHGYSNAFRDQYLVPMGAALWSASKAQVLAAPAETSISFYANHNMLQLFGRPQWLTPRKRSAEYVEAISGVLGSRLRLSSAVESVTRKANKWTVRYRGDKSEVFDHVLFACHSDVAAKLLGGGGPPAVLDELRAIPYADNEVYLHSDTSLMPRRRAAWASWNYIESEKSSSAAEKPVFVSYWLNKLQGLTCRRQLFISLNPPKAPAPSLTHMRTTMAHPQYTPRSAEAARKLRLDLQGAQGLWFAGAYMGYGFHEDAMKSGFSAAAQLSGKALPWIAPGSRTAILLPKQRSAAAPPGAPERGAVAAAERMLWMLTSILLLPLTLLAHLAYYGARSLYMDLCRHAVCGFLQTSVRYGRLVLHLPDQTTLAFGMSEARAAADGRAGWRRSDVGVVGAVGAPGAVEVMVKDPWFFVRVAMEFDLGLARSYMAGEWEVIGTGSYADGLTRLLNLFVSNRDSPKSSFSEANLFTAAVGMAVNALYYRLTMQNTLSGSRANIHAHYDLSNHLFSEFLDKELMMYSSAIYATAPDKGAVGGLKLYGSLEDAELRKVDTLLDRLNLNSGCTLLDVGFGWGGISIRAAERFGCRVHGITLSIEQKKLAEQRRAMKGVDHLVTFEMKDYRVLAMERPGAFDRIVSCEMIEAVGHEFLPAFFEAMEALLARDGIFVMEAITTPEPRYEAYRRSTDFINTIIFPGSCCPSMTALLDAMASKSKMYCLDVQNIDVHYARTLRDWRVRFCDAIASGALPAAKYDDEFVRCWNYYLCYCETGFITQTEHCLILTFTRPGNPNATCFRSVPSISTVSLPE